MAELLAICMTMEFVKKASRFGWEFEVCKRSKLHVWLAVFE